MLLMTSGLETERVYSKKIHLLPQVEKCKSENENGIKNTRMWANAQRDGRPAEHRWRPLFNAAKFS